MRTLENGSLCPPHPDTTPFPRPRHPRYPTPMQHQLNRHHRQRICQKEAWKVLRAQREYIQNRLDLDNSSRICRGGFCRGLVSQHAETIAGETIPDRRSARRPCSPEGGRGTRPYSSEAAFRSVTQPGALPIGAFKTIQDNIRSLATKRTGAYGSTSTSTSSPSTLTGNTCSPWGAGPMTTSPVMTSNIAPCSAHITSLPSR